MHESTLCSRLEEIGDWRFLEELNDVGGLLMIGVGFFLVRPLKEGLCLGLMGMFSLLMGECCMTCSRICLKYNLPLGICVSLTII